MIKPTDVLELMTMASVYETFEFIEHIKAIREILGHMASKSSACAMVIQHPVLVIRKVLRSILIEGIFSSRNLAATMSPHAACMVSSIGFAEIGVGNPQLQLWNPVSHGMRWKCRACSFIYFCSMCRLDHRR